MKNAWLWYGQQRTEARTSIYNDPVCVRAAAPPGGGGNEAMNIRSKTHENKKSDPQKTQERDGEQKKNERVRKQEDRDTQSVPFKTTTHTAQNENEQEHTKLKQRESRQTTGNKITQEAIISSLSRVSNIPKPQTQAYNMYIPNRKRVRSTRKEFVLVCIGFPPPCFWVWVLFFFLLSPAVRLRSSIRQRRPERVACSGVEEQPPANASRFRAFLCDAAAHASQGSATESQIAC